MKRDTLREQAFTLVELAVVLVIMGVVGYLLYGSIFQLVRSEKSDQGERILETLADQMTGYILTEDLGNGTLPAPDSGFLPSTVASAQDPWGHRIRYWRGTDKGLSSATSTTLYLRVYDDATAFYNDNIGGAVTGAGGSVQFVKNVGYIVLSDGPDGVADYREVPGSTYISVLKKGMPVLDATGQTVSSFDDIVQYKTLDQLKSAYASNSPLATASSSRSAPEGAIASSADVEENYTNLMGGASIVSDPGVPDGKVLDLTGSGDYVDLSNSTAGTTTYTQYTVMGWFKTTGTSQTGDFDVIAARMNSGASSQRTFWVVLWGTSYLTQGDGTKIRGELGFKGATSVTQSGDNDFIVDTQCQNHGGVPCHHDANWHFFCLRVYNDTAISANRYEATLFVNYAVNGTLTRFPSSEAARTTDDPNGWTISDHAPLNGATYITYLGREPGSLTRNFQGYLDDILIYDTALTDEEITTYYENNKAFYN
jgi:prepilin-type N-terminal cleavage/methylation domain-containing protein